jgi:phosphoribosylformimino-5-aminoimidazole carboxamide ribotide isomerase
VILYPAIDILGAKAVRLVRGDFEQQTVYEDDPFRAAAAWVEAGARWLHVVDLDGARSGKPASLEHLHQIATKLDVPVQYGGGLRTADAIGEAIEAGAARVVLGTAAFTRPELLERALADNGPERIVVSVDTRAGRVATAGWTETTELSASDVVERLTAAGVANFVYTDVDRDGLLEGPDLEGVAALASRVRGNLLYSGGVGALADLEALASLAAPSLTGVIVGKALYERRFSVGEGQAALDAAAALQR